MTRYKSAVLASANKAYGLVVLAPNGDLKDKPESRRWYACLSCVLNYLPNAR